MTGGMMHLHHCILHVEWLRIKKVEYPLHYDFRAHIVRIYFLVSQLFVSIFASERPKHSHAMLVRPMHRSIHSLHAHISANHSQIVAINSILPHLQFLTLPRHWHTYYDLDLSS